MHKTIKASVKHGQLCNIARATTIDLFSGFGTGWLINPVPAKVYLSEEEQKKLLKPVFKEIAQAVFVVENIYNLVKKFNDI